jgi:cytochrome c oxidase assembly factor 6
MGFFSSSSDKLPAPKISTDGTPIAPDRSARAKCWEARDAYFQCLDKNTIIDSLTNKDAAEKACGAENKGFEKNCASSWVGFTSLLLDFSGGGSRLWRIWVDAQAW